MSKIIKNTLLNYIPNEYKIEDTINSNRIFNFNNNKIKNSKGPIIYLIQREIRANDNFALQFAIQKSKELNSSLKIIYPQKICNNKAKQDFIDKQIEQTAKDYEKLNLKFEIFKGDKTKLLNYLNNIKIKFLIIDFNPIENNNYLNNASFKIYEIDGHNIVPARVLSDKQEYNAATFRRKIYYNIFPYLTEFKNKYPTQNDSTIHLKNFIDHKLTNYAEFKNNPTHNVLSGLSKYLNLGFISPQRVAMEIIKANVDDINKEIFLEELIIRDELADNFCLYCKNFKTLSCIPNWAKQSLKEHLKDIRSHIYTIEELEFAKTYDELWNATQIQLLNEGTIHGYLRMYWAKKILEWTPTPKIALEIAIYLNDKYAYDSPSSNGYTGILWAIGGLHDRAFQNFPVTGKIRRMTYNSIKNKFNINNYINKFD